jgi:hypothetical protein
MVNKKPLKRGVKCWSDCSYRFIEDSLEAKLTSLSYASLPLRMVNFFEDRSFLSLSLEVPAKGYLKLTFCTVKGVFQGFAVLGHRGAP